MTQQSALIAARGSESLHAAGEGPECHPGSPPPALLLSGSGGVAAEGEG